MFIPQSWPAGGEGACRGLSSSPPLLTPASPHSFPGGRSVQMPLCARSGEQSSQWASSPVWTTVEHHPCRELCPDPMEKLVGGCGCCISWDGVQDHWATSNGQGWSEVRGGTGVSTPRPLSGAWWAQNLDPNLETPHWSDHRPTPKGTWTSTPPSSYMGQ